MDNNDKKVLINARLCQQAHMKAFETWEQGEIKDVWLDDSNNICIRYTSGNWWHYKFLNKNNIEWW